MSLELLDKTRKIQHILNEQASDKIDFTEFCQILSHALHAVVLLISPKGKVLGQKALTEIPAIPELQELDHGSYLEPSMQERFLNVLSTQENANLMTLGFQSDGLEQYQSMIVPVRISGKRLGTLVLYRLDPIFSIDDIILAEYGATVIALAMQRALSEEQAEEQHKEEDMEVVVRTLTKLEGKAMLYILEELDGRTKGTLIASRLADQVGITRSVIVNALKKCESAGVIQTKSFGVKGTSIQVLNELFTSEMLLRNMN